MSGEPYDLNMEKLLGVIRLSNLTDESTSPERQKEIIEAAALTRGAKIVGWAVDLDVSAAKVPPADRPELGQWMKQPELYDGMIFWKLDRFVRNVIDFADMIKWGEQTKTNLISATEPLDLSTPIGKALAMLIATFAEMEVENIKIRVKGSHAYLRKVGRWGGGTYPYGYVPERLPTGGWRMVQDDITAPIVKEAVKRAIDGESLRSICADFNDRMLPTSRTRQDADRGRAETKRTGRWHHTSLKHILTSQGLLGAAVHDGKPVRDDAGMPVRRGEPLITRQEFDRLQAALAKGSDKWGKSERFEISLLSGVAFCSLCGEKLYRRRVNRRGKQYHYYICSGAWYRRSGCRNGSVSVEELEAFVEDQILQEVGDLEVEEAIAVLGVDHSEEIAEIDAALMELADDRASGLFRGEAGTARYRATVSKLEARREELEREPASGNRAEYRPTGRSFRQVWDAADTDQRRALMLASGIRVEARRSGPHQEARIILSARLKDRLMEAARKA